MNYLSDIQRLVLVVFITILAISALRDIRHKKIAPIKKGAPAWISILIVLAVLLLNLNFYITAYSLQIFLAITFILGILVAYWSESHLARRHGEGLVESGPYNLVRHPVYAGLIVAYLSFLILFFNPVIIVLTAIYLALLVFASVSEERFLRETLSGYPDYAKRTGRFLPKIKK